MPERPPFKNQLQAKGDEGKIVCLGLDPDPAKLPKFLLETYGQEGLGIAFADFCEKIVDATADVVAAYKPNSAFFERLPDGEGEEALKEVVDYIHRKHPDIPVIGDIKRADIGNTNKGYAEMAFERFGFDAATVNPYFGGDTLEPFLQYPDRGLFILCRTTNPGSKELQDMPIDTGEAENKGLLTNEELREFLNKVNHSSVSLYEVVAFLAARRWNSSGNLGLVVGATHPEAFAPVRKLAGDLPFLIPGIGTQGGDVEATLKYAPDSKGQGMIINSGSAILYASSGEDFAEAAREATLKLHNQITELRAKNG